MQLTSRIFHPTDDFAFNSLYGAVAAKITLINQENEFTLHQKFKQKVKELFAEELG